MDLHFYFDTAVLGPTYEDGNRHLVLSVSAAWEGGELPNDKLRALLQPWCWQAIECALYRTKDSTLEKVPDEMAFEPIALGKDWQPAELKDNDPVRQRLESLYSRCAAEEDEGPHHRFRLGVAKPDDREAPDLPNGQHWPDLLASAGRWPGLLPYRLNLQIAFRVKKEAIVDGAIYFIAPTSMSTQMDQGAIVSTGDPALPKNETVHGEGDSVISAGQDEATIEYRWTADAAGPVIAKARIGGRAAPGPNQAAATGALLDLATLWGRLDDVSGFASQDWFAAVPEMVAEACDLPDALFDALSQLVSADDAAPDVTKLLQERFEKLEQREALITFAVQAWALRYGVLNRVGSNGGHPLTSILSALPGEAYDTENWGDVLASLALQTMPALDDVIAVHNASAEQQSLRILPINGKLTADGLDKRSGLDFLRETARTFAWLTSDAGLFALYMSPWQAAVERHASVHPGSKVLERLQEWLASEKRDSFPLGAMVRGTWCTNGESVMRPQTAPRPAKPLLAVVDRLHEAPTGDPKDLLAAVLSNVDDDPILPNAPLRQYLAASGIRSDAILFEALAEALRTRIQALRRIHLDGSGRSVPDVPAGYPAAFGDPWPLDRVHDLMFPIDRPGHVDSDDGHLEDLRRQIAGIGLLVRQAGKPWHCLASASIVPEGTSALQYSALSGQPAAFAGELRTTMVAYRGEPWFERGVNEALAVGYAGEADADSALTDVQAKAHDIVRFPDLKFGQRYYCAPFLIGPGNALPSELCDGPEGARLHPAHPRPELFSAGGIAADAMTVGVGPFHYLRRVPVSAPLLEPRDSGTLFSRREDVHPLAHEVLASTTPSEEPLTLLCPPQQWLGATEQFFRLQPPEVDMMVWLRHWRALIAANNGGAPGGQWPDQLKQTLAAWMKQADAIADKPESAKALPKFHDPAHEAYLIEIEEVWPKTAEAKASRVLPVEGDQGDPAWKAPNGRTRATTVQIAAAAATGGVPKIDPQGADIVISGLQKGRVYRVSASALVKAERFAGYSDVDKDLQGKKVFAPVEVFGHSVGTAHAATGYIRFASRTVLAEVATEEMPQVPVPENAQAPVIAQARASALDHAMKPAFDGRTLTVAADFSDAVGNGWRYIRTLVLERQRWAWSGRHVDQAKVDALVPRGNDRAAFTPSDADSFESWGFHGRSPDDHVREFAASAANDARTLLWREDLQSRRAAEYHRFRLRARSRYAGLMKDQTTAESFTEKWVPFALKFRPGATALPRPKIAMLLPLTGGYEETKGSRKLACLVQLEEGAFDEAGLPERIVVEAEMAGPDPILIQTRPTSALKLDCKTHGPIGHSFDPDLPGAKYRRASWITSFDTHAGDAATAHPWSLVKLHVRREVARQWVWPMTSDHLVSEDVSAGWIQLPRPSDQILLRNASAKPESVAASGLRVKRVEAKSLVTVVRFGAGDAVPLALEPGFEAMFAVLTYQAIDARGIPGAEQILAEAAVLDSNVLDMGVENLQRAPAGTLRLRLLTVQRNPRADDQGSKICRSLSDLFARVGQTETSDARFRLMRVSLPIEEA